MSKKQSWPENCIWPEPIWDGEGPSYLWEADDFYFDDIDKEGEDLLDIREYFDSLVEEGRLQADYSLNMDYADFWADQDDMDSDDDEVQDSDPEEFIPEKGEEYWDQGFDMEAWEEDYFHHINLLKIPPCDFATDPVRFVCRVIGYEFINENLLRQAFTRRAFSIEYGIRGCYEELEFLGDSVLNTVVTKVIVRQLMETDIDHPEAPFGSRQKGYDEGVLTKIRSQYISKDYLAIRAVDLGLHQYILYGTGEEMTESSYEDVMEALIGAVAIDSDWNWEILEQVVDQLLCIQLTYPDRFLKATHYDLVNSWHQKHFGCMPSYEVYGEKTVYCAIRFSVPENDQGICTAQRIDVSAETRSAAREEAAFQAYGFLVSHGLWVNLKDAHLIPDMENSINQLQELYQKKYIEDAPQYTFEPWSGDEWNCDCTCGGVNGYGRAIGKTKAKKKAAYMVLIRLLKAAGICEKEWEEQMWENLMN